VCLSGFLIPKSFEDSSGWLHFAWKRLLRVGPAFITALAFIATVFGPRMALQSLTPYFTIGLVMVGVDAVLWSLMVEEFLYASHAILRRTKLWGIAAVVLLGAICVVGALLGPQPAVLRLFQCGAAYSLGNLAYLFRQRLSKIDWRLVGLLAIAAIACFQFTSFTPIMLCGSVFTILALWRAPQVKLRIPDLSYGMYIYHQPILIALKGKLGVDGMWLLIWTFAMVIPAAITSWYLLESRALKLKDLPWQFRQKPTQATATGSFR
jgi:peptidoglycan/LPS O-acetylase OafA/YrhL